MNHGTGLPVLRVVVVTRNEEQAIARCLESVVREITGMNAEILLVDSASTDRTTEIAASYPVRVIHLPDSPFLSPAAGRYAGSAGSNAEFLFFLDGDMILEPGWLRGAVSLFSEPSLGAVAGFLYDVRPGEEVHKGNPIDTREGDVPLLGGAALYRGSALLQSGTFSPSLFGEEERELAFRLLQKGYAVRRIPEPMAYHFMKERTRAELDEKSKYYTGVGQIARVYFPRSIVWDLVREHPSLLRFNMLVAGFLAVVLAGFVSGMPWLAGAPVFAGAGILLFLGLVKGWEKLYLYLRSKIMIMLNILKGCRRGLEPPELFMRRLTAGKA